jgi:hypothetical protein
MDPTAESVRVGRSIVDLAKGKPAQDCLRLWFEFPVWFLGAAGGEVQNSLCRGPGRFSCGRNPNAVPFFEADLSLVRVISPWMIEKSVVLPRRLARRSARAIAPI